MAKAYSPESQRRRGCLENGQDATRAADMSTEFVPLQAKYPTTRAGDLNEIIQEMILLLHDEANRYSIPIRAELTPSLPKVTADRVQLQQVLMNLMLNGIEAMKDTAVN